MEITRNSKEIYLIVEDIMNNIEEYFKIFSQIIRKYFYENFVRNLIQNQNQNFSDSSKYIIDIDNFKL